MDRPSNAAEGLSMAPSQTMTASTASAASAITLTTIPVEILRMIFVEFSWYHNKQADSANHKALCCRSLLALSKTCRRLCAVAQPFLYYDPARICLYGNLLGTSRRFLLLRTLVDRPDLAACVRRLGPMARERCGFEEEELRFCKATARRLELTLPNDPDWNCLDGQTTRSQASSFYSQLFLALAPNVKTFVLELLGTDLAEGDFQTSFFVLTERLTSLHEAALLPRLGHVQICTNTYGMLGQESPVTLALPRIAPFMTQLRIQAVVGSAGDDIGPDGEAKCGLPMVPNLRVLELAKGGFEDTQFPYLLKLITRCPSLERFRFSADGFINEFGTEHLTPRSFLDALQHVRKTLRHLHLDFNDASFDLDEHQEFGALLPTFDRLETLKLDIAAFVFDDMDGESLQDNAACLTDILPNSIRHLRLMINHLEHSNLWVQILDLAKAAGAGKFPELSQVELCASSSGERMFTDEAFVKIKGWTRKQVTDVRTELAKAAVTFTCMTGEEYYDEEMPCLVTD